MSKMLSMLTPKSPRMDGAGRGTSQMEITPSDVAMALAFATSSGDRWIKNHCQYHTILVRHCDQWPNKEETEIVLFEIQSMVLRSWAVKGKGHSDRFNRRNVKPLAVAAWAETTGDRMILRELANISGKSVRWWEVYAKNIYSDVRSDIESLYSQGIAKICNELA